MFDFPADTEKKNMVGLVQQATIDLIYFTPFESFMVVLINVWETCKVLPNPCSQNSEEGPVLNKSVTA